jgi:hypothetical protein
MSWLGKMSGEKVKWKRLDGRREKNEHLSLEGRDSVLEVAGAGALDGGVKPQGSDELLIFRGLRKLDTQLTAFGRKTSNLGVHRRKNVRLWRRSCGCNWHRITAGQI